MILVFGAVGLSLIALFIAMGASSKADVAARRLQALERRLAAEADASENPEPAGTSPAGAEAD